MAKQVNVSFADKSDSARSARMWSKLTKRFVSASEAKDLDLTFSGGPADTKLGAEPMSPIQDNDEEPTTSPSNRAKTRPLARGAIRASTNRLPLAR